MAINQDNVADKLIPTTGNLSISGGTFTPVTTSGIVGTTLADNANAGSIGEYVSSTVTQASPASLTSGSTNNVTSISLTAGDWDVFGNMGITGGATTILNYLTAGITTVSNSSLPANEETWTVSTPVGGQALFNQQTFITSALTTTRINVSTTTTVYMNMKSNFTTSTLSGFGRLSARRRR
jgi:hypothetical protein